MSSKQAQLHGNIAQQVLVRPVSQGADSREQSPHTQPLALKQHCRSRIEQPYQPV